MDRMLGPLVRYLRFMGYDTLAATELGPGGPREDSALLRLAAAEGRVLLTRDRELAGRGGVLVRGDDVLEQVAALARAGLVEPVLRLDRCSRCNTLLRPAAPDELAAAPYLPADRGEPRPSTAATPATVSTGPAPMRTGSPSGSTGSPARRSDCRAGPR